MENKKFNIKEAGKNTVKAMLDNQPSEYARLNEMFKNDKLIKEYSYSTQNNKEK
jgi:hypothetical protein